MNPDRKDWPRLKRLMEYICADPEIREAAWREEYDAVSERTGGLFPADETLRDACRAVFAYRYPQHAKASFEDNCWYRLFCENDREGISRIRARRESSAFRTSALERYNKAVYARTRVETPLLRTRPYIEYYPVMFELSEGCSVQCYFCGLDAECLKSCFTMTEEHAVLFRECMENARDLIGEIASMGACYLATEPFDNPDYEAFLKIFQEVFGCYPQTTTAAGEQDPARMRAFFKQLGSEELKHRAIRFSVRSLSQFRKMMELYTPEELQDIELLFNHPYSDSRFSNTGKVRRLPEKFRKKIAAADYSIVCLAGLCVNFSSMTLRWIEPELPSELCPNGYRLLEEVPFRSAEEFRSEAARLIACYAAGGVNCRRKLRLSAGVSAEFEGNMVSLKAAGGVLRVTGNRIFQESIKLLLETPMSFEELCERLELTPFTAGELEKKLTPLYEKGYIRC